VAGPAHHPDGAPGRAGGYPLGVFVTRTTISVPPSWCIMAIGVATSNSILMITFANEQRRPELWQPGRARRRAGRRAHAASPGSHDGAAMLLGMLPMSLASEKGASRTRRSAERSSAGCSSPPSTRFFVPVAYSRLRRKRRAAGDEDEK